MFLPKVFNQIESLDQIPILFFDGDCLLCSRIVHWIIENDKKGVIFFCTLEDGRKAGLKGLENDSVALKYLNEIHLKSDATSQILKILGGRYIIFKYILDAVPYQISNSLYDIIAKYRYIWFGKKHKCLLPQPEWAHRILSFEQLKNNINL